VGNFKIWKAEKRHRKDVAERTSSASGAESLAGTPVKSFKLSAQIGSLRKFTLECTAGDGESLDLSVIEANQQELVRQALTVLAAKWPAAGFVVEADSSGAITAIRES
jgi:hypothetical protein